MPLVPKDFGGVERVETADGDWYDIRRELGFYHRSRISDVNAIVLHLQWGKVKKSEQDLLDDDDLVPATLENKSDVNLAKISAYLKAWSHQDTITEKNIKRIPRAHAELIMEKIEELEEAHDELTETSPLDESPGI